MYVLWQERTAIVRRYMYRPNMSFIDKSNRQGKVLNDDYEAKKCQGKDCKTINLPTERQAEYSLRVFGKRLCWTCQAKETASKR